MRFGFIQQQTTRYPVRVLCRVLKVSASGYYAWRSRPPSRRERANQELLGRIRRIHQSSRQTYGSPRVHAELIAQGRGCAVKRVARLMRQAGLIAVPRRRYVVTTEPYGGWPAAPNLLARRFRPGGVRAWMADLTYVHTEEGYLYLALVLSLYSRRVLGWSMGATPAGALALDALKMALDQEQPAQGQLHHSDRGGHYAAGSYRALLHRHGMRVSLSRRGDCYDNAVVESFFATLKRELLYHRRIRTRAEARQLIFEYIEVWYNRQRRHSALGYLSPVEYEKLTGAP